MKAIITDLDKTLLHTDKTVSEYTATVLKKCREQGKLAMLCHFLNRGITHDKILNLPSADKGFDGKYAITDSTKVGDTVEVRFDVYKNALWTGNVNRIRFDHFNMTAPFEIDYIRLYKLTDK